MPELLLPGDVIIFHTKHKRPNGVAVGQGLAQVLKFGTVVPSLYSASSDAVHGKPLVSSFTTISNANAVHAAILVKKRNIGTNYDIAHVTGGGPTQDYLKDNMRLYGGRMAIYRLAERTNLAASVAKVSVRWAPNQVNAPKDRRFAGGKAFSCAFHSSGYGPQAQARANFYARHQLTRGGPRDAKNEEDFTHKSFFCSMFAIACFQAAVSPAQRKMFMALDAKHTSPMVLENFLLAHPSWSTVDHGESVD